MTNQQSVLEAKLKTSSSKLHRSNGNHRKVAKTGKATISGVAWRAGSTLNFAGWVEQGRRLGIIGRSVAWWIGDWLNWGNSAYGERYVRAARITGYDAQTLMNMSYVASRFDVSRRRENLSWSHHAELAALDPAEQDRWLDRAKDDRLSVRCLRDELRRKRLVEANQQAELESSEDKAQSQNGRAERPRAVCPQCGYRIDAEKQA